MLGGAGAVLGLLWCAAACLLLWLPQLREACWCLSKPAVWLTLGGRKAGAAPIRALRQKHPPSAALTNMGGQGLRCQWLNASAG